jgi:hypothetical protein
MGSLGDEGDPMVQLKYVGLLVWLGSTLADGEANAGSLRCGDRLASRGASLQEVRATCGEPDAAERRVSYRTIKHRVQVPCADARERYCEVVHEETIELVTDHWTYDFGRNRFVEHAVFEQGALVDVKSGGYGHKG